MKKLDELKIVMDCLMQRYAERVPDVKKNSFISGQRGGHSS